jgi:YHS domain-containing protein
MLRTILLLLLVAFVARAFWRVIDGVRDGLSGADPGASGGTRVGGVQMVRDPVCGTFVVPSRALTLSAGGRQFHFCSARCRDAFNARAMSSGRTA